MSLQHLYRPTTLKGLVGNKEAAESINHVLGRKQIPTAFLLTGPSGCGKTTLGRIISRMLECSEEDFKELNSSDNTGVDGIRELINEMRLSPINGKKKVFLLDEAHSLTKNSQEALLKALEEPPPYVHWIICTTNPEKFKDTFKRRCHNYTLEELKDSQIKKYLKKVLRKEKVKNFSEDVLDRIVEISDGSLGKALKNLDMVIDFEDADKAISTLKSTAATEEDVLDICRTLCNYRMGEDAKWNKVKKIIPSIKSDAESARRQILGYLEKVLINNGGAETAIMMDELKHHVMDSGRPGLTLQIYSAIYSSDE